MADDQSDSPLVEPNRGPDFFIVGAPKSGTSAMHQYLRQHPALYLPDRKDVPFFGSDLDHTVPGAPASLAEYLSWFSDAPRNVRLGDSCTLYMQSRRAAEEIARWRPEASIIVMVRDPVDLMVSLHSQNVWMTEEDILDFETAVMAEDERRAGRRIPALCNFPAGLWYRDVAALGDQLARYFAAFPRENVHVVVFDEFRRNTQQAVGRTLEFLGVSHKVPLELDIVNARRAPRSVAVQRFLQQPPPALERAFDTVVPRRLQGRLLPFLTKFNEAQGAQQTLSDEVSARLRSEMRPQVERLEALLGQGLGWGIP